MSDKKSAEDIFGRSGGGEYESISGYVGEVLELVEVTNIDDGKQYTSITFTALHDGELKEFWTSSGGVVGKLREANDADVLSGFKVQVVSGPGSYGKPWYDLEPAGN